MRHRSGLTYWQEANGSPPPAPRLSGDATCHTVVIGGGITGMSVAHYLVRAGIETVVLEKGQLAMQSTAASTGLLQYEIDTPLHQLIPLVGEHCAVRAYQSGLEAIDAIESVVSELPDACGFERRSSLYFASEPSHFKDLQEEFECRRHFGFDVQLLNRKQLRDIGSMDAAGAIRSHGDAQVDPYRLTCELARLGQSRGLRIFADTPLERCDRIAGGIVVHTPRGRIRAENVVFATGYGSDVHLGRQLGRLKSTYVATSLPLTQQDGWPDQCLIWETARPYFYARQTSDGRAMIGGEDTPFQDDHQREQLVERQVERLCQRFRSLFPQLEFVTDLVWAGTFAETKDGLAYIGRSPDCDRAYFAIGYGGNGITFSFIAARLLTDLISGRRNPDADVFRFTR